MKRLALFVLILAAGWAHAAPSTAPTVAGCPSPVPPAWPAGSCKYQFYPLTDTVHAIASASKVAPVYAHTLSGYIGSKFLGLVVACPSGATVNAGSCTDAHGVDASALVTLAGLNSFQISTGSPPTPVTKTVGLTWTAPTLNVDNSPVTPGEITAYNIYLTAGAAPQAKIGSTVPGVLTFITQPLGVGAYVFAVTAVAGSQESAGAQISLNIAGIPPPPPIPAKPVNVTGTVH